jgi:hypothetical protein
MHECAQHGTLIQYAVPFCNVQRPSIFGDWEEAGTFRAELEDW